MIHPTAQKVADHARDSGVDIEVIEFEIPTRTAQQAAAALGCTVAQIVKSLVFAVDGQPTMALVSGGNQLDEKKLAAACGVGRGKVKRAPAEMVRAATGYAIGGVPPFAHATRMPVYIDADFEQFEVIWAAAGTPNTVFALTPAQLIEITRGTPLDLKKD